MGGPGQRRRETDAPSGRTIARKGCRGQPRPPRGGHPEGSEGQAPSRSAQSRPSPPHGPPAAAATGTGSRPGRLLGAGWGGGAWARPAPRPAPRAGGGGGVAPPLRPGRPPPPTIAAEGRPPGAAVPCELQHGPDGGPKGAARAPSRRTQCSRAIAGRSAARPHLSSAEGPRRATGSE